MKAVVCRDVNQFGVEEVELDPPKAGEIKVKMKAVGVCHSDLSVINGAFPLPPPIVIGHEGAGIVEEVGEGVTRFAPGDHVVLSFIPSCGECRDCHSHRPHLCSRGVPDGRMLDGTARVHKDGKDISIMQYLGCMAEYAVIPQASAVKIDPEIPLDKAALVGCGVMTGVGAAINTAGVEAGSSVAVFGCGGVGLSIIQGARLAGAGTIIAVDIAANKLDMATHFGATNIINSSSDTDPVARIQELTGGGANYGFEAVGIPKLMEQTNDCVRRGGTAVMVGVGSLMDSVTFNALMISMSAKTVKGCFYGDANPPVDFPRLLSLYQCGKLNLDDMISKRYSIDEAPQAFADMEKSANARGVIVFD